MSSTRLATIAPPVPLTIEEHVAYTQIITEPFRSYHETFTAVTPNCETIMQDPDNIEQQNNEFLAKLETRDAVMRATNGEKLPQSFGNRKERRRLESLLKKAKL